MPHNWALILFCHWFCFVLTDPYLDDLGCEREKGHERGLREISSAGPSLDPWVFLHPWMQSKIFLCWIASPRWIYHLLPQAFLPQPCKRRCLWSHPAPQKHRFWQSSYTTYTQSGPCWLLHEHRHWEVHRQLATHLAVSFFYHEHRPGRNHLGEGKPRANTTGDVCQRTYVPYPECDPKDLYSWYWTHHSDVLEDDPVLHRHLSLWTNSRLTHGFSPLSPALCMMVVALSEENLVPNLPHHPDHNGPLSPPTSLCGQQTLSCRPFLGLRNLFYQLSAPGVLRQPNHLGNGAGSRVFLAFALSSNPSHYATALHVNFQTKLWHHFSASPLAVQLSGFISRLFSGRQNVRTLPRNGLEVLPRCIVCTEQQVFVNSDLTAAAKAYSPIPSHVNHCGKTLCGSTVIVFSFSRFSRPIPMSHLLQIMIMSHLHFLRRHSSLFTLNFVPAYIFRNLSDLARWPLRLLPHLSRFKNQFFFSFFHDVHHAYLLLHRAMALLPPTLIPNIETDTFYPVPKYGTNQKAYDRTTLILPTPLLMLYTFPHLTSLKKKPLMDELIGNPIFQKPHQTCCCSATWYPSRSFEAFLPRHRHLRSASRKPKQLPKHQSKRRRHHEQSRFRSSSPLTT